MGGQQKSFFRKTSAGFTAEMYIPAGARYVRLLVSDIVTIDKQKLDKHFDSVAGIKKAYKAFSTIFKAAFKEISYN